MTPRRLLILGIAAVLAIGGGLWLAQRQSATPASAYGLIYPELKKQLDSVNAVRIYKAGDARAVEIARKESSHQSTWGVTERAGYPVDAAKLRKLLLAIADAKVFEQKTSDPAQYKSLGVEDTTAADATSVRIELAGTAQPVNLIVGKQGIGAQSQYVRRAGETQSWLVSTSIDSAATPDAWLAKDIIDVSADRVQSAAITPAGAKTYTISKGSRADADFSVDGVPKGKELSAPSAANSFATSLVGTTLADVQPASAMTRAPNVHATYKTFDGLVAEIDGWAHDDQHYVAIKTSFDAAQAERFKTPTADDKKDPKAGESAKPDAKAAQKANSAAAPEKPAAPDVAGQAVTLNTQLSGWVYEIPSYKYEAIFRPLDELLKHDTPKQNELFRKK
jgi:Domain of unknown function (DUF4340)